MKAIIVVLLVLPIQSLNFSGTFEALTFRDLHLN